jgi:hypothetical protein
MATFTHTITWQFNIEGEGQAFANTYDITDVDDVECTTSSKRRATIGAGGFYGEPVFIAVFCGAAQSGVDIGGLSERAIVPQGGSFFVHQSSTGGHFLDTSTASPTNLNPATDASVNTYTATTGQTYIIALHQPAS